MVAFYNFTFVLQVYGYNIISLNKWTKHSLTAKELSLFMKKSVRKTESDI